MKNLDLSKKLPAATVVLVAVAVAITGVMAFFQAQEAVKAEAFNKLEAVAAGRAAQITSYLESIDEDLEVVASGETAAEALVAFGQAFEEMGATAESALHEAYIGANPHPAGERQKLVQADDGSPYSAVHAQYHPWFLTLQQERGYYDVFLIDDAGAVVYSVFKEADFATNLVSGKWSNSGLAEVVTRVKGRPAGTVGFTDFAPYAPSNGAPASFVATPITGADGGYLGALVFQMPVGRINAIAQQQDGMGESGEIYLVGADKLMRTDSRFSSDSTILERRVDTPQVTKALAGERGLLVGGDYRGTEVLASYLPISFHGVTWAGIAEIDMAEVTAPVVSMGLAMLLAVGVILAVVAVAAVFLARTVTVPVADMTGAMSNLAEGNLEADVPARGRGDEIGRMAAAVQVFKDNAIRVRQMEAEEAERQRRAAEEKRAAMEQLAAEFEASVGAVVQTVSSAATEMQSTAQSMSAISEETSSQATTVAAASEQATANVQTVSAAAQELSNSIEEISRQVQKSNDVAQSAADKVRRTNTQIQSLATAADRIGEVVQLITDIAAQTNLLALNATIEAARAGEAGKGFAVVASEVKNLANQTAKATEEIVSQIASVQTETRDAVRAIDEIGQVISDVGSIAASIAAAMEQQDAATREIARNVEQAATGTGEVSSTIQGVTQAAQEAGAASSQVLSSAGNLAQQSETLRSEVSRFIASIRAA